MIAALRTSSPAALLLAALLACEPSADTPVDPAWSKQPCEHCGMVVSEPRFAAEVVRANGARVFFDDVGCMMAFVDEQRSPVRHAWVNDGHRWIDARKAHFHDEAATPMGFGLVASGDDVGGIAYDDADARVRAKLGAKR